MSGVDSYTCRQVFQLLDDYVDRELTDVEVARVEQHLETCAMCAAESRFEQSLLTGLKSKIRQIDVPASLLRRIEAVLDRTVRSREIDTTEDATD